MLSFPFDLCFFGLCVMDKSKVPASMAWFQWRLGAFGSKANARFGSMLVGSWFYSCLCNRERSISCPTLSDPRLVPAGLRGREKSICCVASPLDWPVHPSPCLNISPSLFFEGGADRGAFVRFISIFFCMTVPPSVHVESNHVKEKKQHVSYFDFVWM